MNSRSLLILALFMLLIVNGCTTDMPSQSTNNPKTTNKTDEKVVKIELTISAAASLEDAFKEIKPLFEEKHRNVKLLFNFGGSGALQKQIIQGAPVDIFFPAAEDRYDELVAKGFIDENQGVDLLKNTLVLIIPKESKNRIKGFNDLANLGEGKLALGTPEAVPAGNYGKQTLEHLGLWNHVQKNIVFAKDVRQVLTYVETGNVDAGLVYKTDALTTENVEIVAEAELNSHEPIVYPVGIIKATRHMKESELFYRFLQENVSKNIFKKYGFNVLD